MNQELVLRSWNLLKYAYGIALIIIGLDKALGTDFIVEWSKYVSPLALEVIPVSATTIVLVLGIVEVIVGVAMLIRFTRIAAILAIIALALIIVNLLSMGLYDIAARDLLIAFGALVLVWLTDALPESVTGKSY
jgi:uncharacterized membrane protein